MDQVKFVEDSYWKIWRPYHLKFFKGCPPHILLGPFLNTLTQLFKTFWKYLHNQPRLASLLKKDIRCIRDEDDD